MPSKKSPIKPEPSPKKIEASPKQITKKPEASPKKVQPSPKKIEPSPKKIEASPKKVQPSPKKIQESPKQMTKKPEPSPKKIDASPKKTDSKMTPTKQQSQKKSEKENQDSMKKIEKRMQDLVNEEISEGETDEELVATFEKELKELNSEELSEGENMSGSEGEEMDELEESGEEEEAVSSSEELASEDEHEAVKEDGFISLKTKKKYPEIKVINTKKNRNYEGRGVIYLGRIPYGFFEKEMKSFFSQFGRVTRLRLSRNKTTGKSKHYAFVEFDTEEVAEIVAKTMNNYYLYGHRLMCQVVPKEKIHQNLFIGANRRMKVVPWKKIARERQNRPKTSQTVNAQIKRLVSKEEQKRKKFKELGIDYDFAGYKAQVPPVPKHTKFEE